jgi:CRP/FNR family transcriptional regulator, cyclic AMP receptor protein
MDPDRLKKAEIFKDLSFAELEKIAPICTEIDFQKGDLVLVGAERAEKFYILEKGSIELKFPNGKTIEISRSGAMVGWSALVSPYTYVGTIHCLENCRFLTFSSWKFLELITAETAIGLKVMNRIAAVIADRLRLVAKGE